MKLSDFGGGGEGLTRNGLVPLCGLFCARSYRQVVGEQRYADLRCCKRRALPQYMLSWRRLENGPHDGRRVVASSLKPQTAAFAMKKMLRRPSLRGKKRDGNSLLSCCAHGSSVSATSHALAAGAEEARPIAHHHRVESR